MTTGLQHKRLAPPSYRKCVNAGCLGLVIFGMAALPAFAGDSTYGKAVEVKSATNFVFDYGEGRYNVRIVGVETPKDLRLSDQGKRFVANLVVGKRVQMRLEYRNRIGEMVSRILTIKTPESRIKDVGLELLRAGLARRLPGYDYKYGEMAAAEKQARSAKRGLWARTQSGG